MKLTTLLVVLGVLLVVFVLWIRSKHLAAGDSIFRPARPAPAPQVRPASLRAVADPAAPYGRDLAGRARPAPGMLGAY